MGKEKHKFSPQSTGKSSESRQQGQKRADTKEKEEKRLDNTCHYEDFSVSLP
ncbi:MAG: hypothetical protein IJ649_06060 [Oscillospiraceae bacterium]|nr:hypothetical protein [Oscillospiraceae bacterium]